MAVLSRMWYVGKETVKFTHGFWKCLINPLAPIPKGKLDPRMPAYPTFLHEWFRVFPWAHHWAYVPMFRHFTFVFFILSGVGYYIMKPHLIIIRNQIWDPVQHHIEANVFYASHQRKQDVKYFKENDVMAKLRPKYFARDLSGADFHYFPLGFSWEEH